jgi:hypothetical protein
MIRGDYKVKSLLKSTGFPKRATVVGRRTISGSTIPGKIYLKILMKNILKYTRLKNGVNS